jgi:Concanavalin A-like lectin/glucanases superfamily/Bacterial Ig domain
MLSKNRVWTVRPQRRTFQLFLRTFIFLSVFSLSFINKTNAPDAPAPQVITELRFDDGSGTTAADASGNGHNGTLVNGPTWGPGKYGQAVNLDGTNDYVNLTDNADYTLNPAQSYTWSGWVRNNNFNQWSTVWSQTINTSNYFYFYAHSSSDPDAGPVTNGISVHWYNGTNKLAMHSNNNVLTAGQWSYIAITYDASKTQSTRFTIYVNGVDVSNRNDVVSSGTIVTLDPTNIRIGSNQPYGEYLNGSVDEVRYYRRLLSVAEIQSDMNTGNTTDVTPPTVSITAPAAGTVSGTINVTANASDNIGVAGVQFLLDGATLGAEDITAPYSVSWNTTTATNGNHNLTARARDAAGNITTSAVVTVNVNNAPPDTQAPTVTVIAPPPGTVAGTINVDATASDNVGVVGVQFLLDGANLGTEDVTAPYSVSWITTGTANGAHILTAKARDAAGNSTTSAPISVTVNNNNLVAAYGFNENTGTTANDNSGNNNTGTLTNGPTWSPSGKFGAAILFDGTNDLVNINSSTSLNLTNGMTIEAWVNPSNLTGYKTVISKENGASNLAYALSANNSTSGSSNQRPDSRIRIGSNTRTVTGTNKLALNTWTHLASTYDGTTIRLYVNGVQVSSLATTGNITTTSDLLRIGGSPALGTQYFAGLIDEVRIYNRALTQAQIQTDMNTPVAPDVTNPTVNITAPAAGNVSGTINVTANASDNIAVTGVQFLLNGANLGAEDVTAPYSVSWNTTTVANGTYTLTARARDAAGNTTTSTDVIVTVNNDTVLPTVSITEPAAGTVAGTLDIKANAADNVGVVGVQFLLNGANLGSEDLTSPYSFTWNTTSLTDGSYTLTARARDAAGNIKVSAGVIVNVLNHPPDTEFPTVAITAPSAGDVVGTINVTANAADNVGIVGVQFLLNGANLGSEDLTSPYSVPWNTVGLTNGTYTLTAKARDAAGNITTSDPVVVNVNNPADAVLPTATITAPNAGNVSGTINVTANASDNIGVVGVKFQVDGNDIGTEDITAPYSVSWNTTGIANGSHTLTAIARDAAGNLGTSPGVIVTVNNDVDAPIINITAPAAGNVSGTINVTATATDNIAVVGVQFLLDGVNLGTEDLTSPYSISWSTLTSFNGPHILTAKARDAAGNIGTSSTVTVNINNSTPTNLIAALGLNEGSGINAADISGNNHNGSVNGATWGAGKYGQALNFNGTSNYVNIPDHADFTLDPTQNYTWSAWVKSNNFGQWQTIWSQTIDVNNFFYFYAHSSTDADAGPVTNGISVYWWTNGGTNKVVLHSNNNVLTAGQWSYITITYNASVAQNSRFSIYVNGTDVTNKTDVASAGTLASINPTNIRIGSNQPWGEYINGAIDEVRYYKRLLTPAEIVTDMNTPIENDATPPTVNITAPANNASVTGTISLTANAADNIGVAGVQFLLDGANLGAEDLTAPYSISWNSTTTTNGSHILTARVRDVSGNTTTSTDVNVTVTNDTEFPTVSITAPGAGTVLGTFDITANASDNTGVVGVQFLLNGANLGTEDLTAPYSFTWNTTTLTDGSYTLTAKARDAAGNITISTPVIVNVMNHPPDTEFPTITITAPSAGEVLGNINVTADAADNVAVVGVQFLLNGVNLGAEDLTTPYSVPWNTSGVTNGSYTITAKVRDAAGNITTADAVIVTVNNPPDTESPTVNITAPNPGNVSGTINVTANASDNAGVAGVQFLIDGNNLGSEDVAAPYSVTFNTGLVANGPHVLSARARDAAGNITTSSNVNINIVASNPPVITAITVTSITLSSAVINWTTNVPANSKVNFGTNTSYGLSTLADSTLVTSHSQTLNGLAPGTLYHYQITSGDLNNTVATSADNSFTSSNLPASIGNLNGHSVFADATGKLIPWTPNPTDGYATVIGLSWNFLLNSVPNDPSTGKPAYYSRSYLNSNTQAVVDWPHNPAGLYSMLTESAMKYYGFTGNVAVMQLVENVTIWHLDHGMTLATDNWPSVPYASGDAGSVNYDGANMGNSTGQGDGDGYIEPDKIGELGNALLQLYKYDGNVRYRDAAIQAGNVLSSKVRVGTISQSPWPYRVNAHTGVVREDYCGDVIGPITLLDNLIASGLGDTAAYRAARTTAWNWMMAFPMQNNVWTQYFEDSPIENPYNVNINNYDAIMTARYLLMHPEFDPSWETHVRALIAWDENKFGQTSFGAMAIKEQLHFSFIMGSHTSRYASVNALLYEKTGDLTAKEKAYRSFNWATYMAKTTGVVIDGPDVNNQWFTDGYGDYVRHFVTGMAAVPEWSPFNQTHLLRTSSVIKNISYGTNSVNYTTFDGTATEVLHVNFNPVTITANGVPLPQRSDLSQPGWTLDVNTKALRIYHVGATQIVISASAAPPAGRMQETKPVMYY